MTPEGGPRAWRAGIVVGLLTVAIGLGVLQATIGLAPADPAGPDRLQLWLVAVGLLGLSMADSTARHAEISALVERAAAGRTSWRHAMGDAYGPPGAVGEAAVLAAIVGPVAPVPVLILLAVVVGLLVPMLLRAGPRRRPPEGGPRLPGIP